MGIEQNIQPSLQQLAERCKAALRNSQSTDRIKWMSRIKKLSEGFELSAGEMAELSEFERKQVNEDAFAKKSDPDTDTTAPSFGGQNEDAKTAFVSDIETTKSQDTNKESLAIKMQRLRAQAVPETAENRPGAELPTQEESRGEEPTESNPVSYNESKPMLEKPDNPIDPLSDFFEAETSQSKDDLNAKNGLELFKQRLLSGSESPSQNIEGQNISTNKVENYFRNVLKNEGYSHSAAEYVISRYLAVPREEIRNKISELKDSTNLGSQEKLDIQRTITSWQQYRDEVMKKIIQNPEEFGLEKDVNKDNTDLPSIDSLYKVLENLSYDEASITRDDEFLFYVNGRELPLRDVVTLSTELLKTVAPEGRDKDKWVNTFRNECLSPFFDQIKENKPQSGDTRDARANKSEARLQMYASLAIFLKEVVIDKAFDSYGRLILDGEPEPGQRTSFPNLELRLPLRIRSDISKIPKERKSEKNRKIRDFFVKRIEKGGESYLGFIRDQYLNNDPLALYDEAGPKWITLFTEEINALLKEVGFTPNEIDDAYGSTLGQLVHTRAGLISDRSQHQKELSQLKQKDNVTDVELGTAKESLDKADHALKKNDREIVEAVRLRLQAPDMCRVMDAGKGTNRKAIDSISDEDPV